MNQTIIFSIIAATISLGGVFIAIGVFKGKINQNAEANKAQDEQMKALASKDELTAAIKRSDEMLAIMTKRAEEDRLKGQSQWREFHEIIAKHSERIGVLENQQNTLMKSLDEIKGDIKSGFRQLQDELKELRNFRNGSN
jgi:DNA repair exonuclease SbcCD ATPase subunit